MDSSQALFSVFQLIPFSPATQSQPFPRRRLQTCLTSSLSSYPLSLRHFLMHNEFTFSCIFQVLFLSNIAWQISLLYNELFSKIYIEIHHIYPKFDFLSTAKSGKGAIWGTNASNARGPEKQNRGPKASRLWNPNARTADLKQPAGLRATARRTAFLLCFCTVCEPFLRLWSAAGPWPLLAWCCPIRIDPFQINS